MLFRSDFNKLASSITETGGRIPGSKRAHPNNLGDIEINIVDAVISDLNGWCEKLGIEKFA